MMTTGHNPIRVLVVDASLRAGSLNDRLASLAASAVEQFAGAVDRARMDDARFIELRRSYEPLVLGLGRLLMMPLPSWWRQRAMRDNWQSSPRLEGGQHH